MLELKTTEKVVNSPTFNSAIYRIDVSGRLSDLSPKAVREKIFFQHSHRKALSFSSCLKARILRFELVILLLLKY